MLPNRKWENPRWWPLNSKRMHLQSNTCGLVDMYILHSKCYASSSLNERISYHVTFIYVSSKFYFMSFNKLSSVISRASCAVIFYCHCIQVFWRLELCNLLWDVSKIQSSLLRKSIFARNSVSYFMGGFFLSLWPLDKHLLPARVLGVADVVRLRIKCVSRRCRPPCRR